MKAALQFAALSGLASTLAVAQVSPEQLQAQRNRASQPAPKIEAAEFHGIHEADVPERTGVPGPTTKMVLECAHGACNLLMAGMRENYPKPGLVQMGLFDRTRASVAKRFPGAQLRGCINLPGDQMPDGPLACKLDGLAGGKRAVLLVPPGPPGEEIVLYTRAK